jgi:transcriptional regulator with XRE-family HTH domain
MSEDVRRIVGSNVRRLRKAAGLSQAELAARMGVDRAYLSGLELGQRNPTIVSLWHLGKALEIDLREFFYRSRSRGGRSDEGR